MEIKTCSKCKEQKPLTEFSQNGKGLRPDCKSCCRANSAAYRQKRMAQDPEGYLKKRANQFARWRKDNLETARARARDGHRYRTFGLSPEDYAKMLVKQDGVCAICRKTCPSGRALAIDHNSETGVIRELLCVNCNSGIGHFKHDPKVLRAAMTYLRRHGF